MSVFILAGIAMAIGWLVIAHRAERAHLTTAMAMVGGGLVVALLIPEDLTDLLDQHSTERVVELILALLLFVDALAVPRGGLFGGQRAGAVRLLLVALPVSLVAAVAVGAVLFPSTSYAVVVVVACTIIPIDLAPATRVTHDNRVPQRVRTLLLVESGYNDGIIAPLFVFALSLTAFDAPTLTEAFAQAVLAAAAAVVVGTVTGMAMAWLLNQLGSRCSAGNIRVCLVLTPLLAYGTAIEISGNGFIAAFVCGIAFRSTRQHHVAADSAGAEDSLVEDLAVLTSMGLWFVFGAAIEYLARIGMPEWQVPVFAAAALTVLRAGPVYLALARSAVPIRERHLLAGLGPRGPASIVLGLLAWQHISDLDDGSMVLYTMVIVVAASVLLHGPATTLVGTGQARR